MISQTAQCWGTDGLSKRFEVGEREFDCLASGSERLTVFGLLSSCSSVCFFLNYTRCVEKSRFGAVTFGKTCFVHSCSKDLSELKSGKECDGLHS